MKAAKDRRDRCGQAEADIRDAAHVAAQEKQISSRGWKRARKESTVKNAEAMAEAR